MRLPTLLFVTALFVCACASQTMEVKPKPVDHDCACHDEFETMYARA